MLIRVVRVHSGGLSGDVRVAALSIRVDTILFRISAQFATYSHRHCYKIVVLHAGGPRIKIRDAIRECVKAP